MTVSCEDWRVTIKCDLMHCELNVMWELFVKNDEKYI